MAIKLLIGGSPCTHWSIAQKNNRETEPSGMGWELFKNYLIAKEKFNPDFFLYENNKSAAQAIKDQIAKELGVGVDPEVRFTYINSALVSAQNRQRFYVTNFGDIEQPEDRGILLKDILETGTDLSQNEKSYCMTASYNGAVAWNTLERNQRTMVADPVRVGCYPSPDGTLKNSQAMRLYSIEGKSVNLTANGGGMGGKTGLYAIPIEFVDDVPVKAVSCADGKEYPIYQVLNGQITIKDKQYDIKLPDGYYIIRKLTVSECRRLQTIPDWYIMPCSNSQNYKMLGNGWTCEVIKWIMQHIPNIENETIDVISLYDGMSCGMIALKELGCNVTMYVAYEIDKYAIQTTMANFPEIVQLGDAFKVRELEWSLEKEVLK